MGFPSPAQDYIEHQLTLDNMPGMAPDKRVIETDCGYAAINPPVRVKEGQVLLIRFCERLQFATLAGKSLISDDGESIEGDALDDVEVIGIVSHFCNRVSDDSPF